MAATTRSTTPTPKLTPQDWQKLKAVLRATDSVVEFKEFLASQDEKPNGSFDFSIGRSLPTIEGLAGTGPFNKLITGLSLEHSAAYYLVMGQDFCDSTSFIRQNIGLDNKDSEDFDRSWDANNNAYMGIALETFLEVMDPQAATKIRQAASAVYFATAIYNRTLDEASKPKLKYAREKAAKNFRHLMALIGAQLSGTTPDLVINAKVVRVARVAARAEYSGNDDDFFDGIDDIE